MNQNAWNTLSNVILQATELADIESSRLVVQVHQIDSHVSVLLCLKQNLFLLIIIYYFILE